MTDFRKKKIVIVGAGISGLSAALHLKINGFSNVCIFEAQNRIGGRIQTMEIGTHFVEMGAQWIHGETGNIIYEIASTNDLIDKDAVSYMDLVVSFNFYPKEREAIFTLLMYLNEKMSDISLLEKHKGSMLSFVEEHFYRFLTDHSADDYKDVYFEAYECLLKFECELNGCKDLSSISTRSYINYVDCGGPQTIELKYGYHSIIDLILRNIPKDWIFKNHNVTKIDWTNLSGKPATCSGDADLLLESGKIKVHCENGGKYLADHVIVTVPLGCLRKYHHSLFHPPLSEPKQLAVSSLGFSALNKVYLNFETPFWTEYAVINVLWRKSFDQHFVNGSYSEESPIPWVKYINRFAYTLSHPNMLCAWVVGEGAIALESLSDEQVLEDCMKLLELLYGKKLPKPTSVLRSSWFSNKFSYGSYSYFSMESENLNVSHLQLAEPEYAFNSQYPVLLFAGEATHPSFFATVHGAYETGRREAERLLQFYKNQQTKLSCHELMLITSKLSNVLSITKNACDTLKVVIIGAGIAGLACASQLVKNQFKNIHILEAQGRIGGRVQSIYYENGSLELGAQWIHGTNNELYKFLKTYGISKPSMTDTSYEGKGKFCTSNGEVIASKLVDEVKEMLDQAKTELEINSSEENRTVLSYFYDAFDSYVRKQNNSLNLDIIRGLYDWYVRFEIVDNGCDSFEEVACQSYREWDDCPMEEYHINIDKGFSSAVDTLRNEASLANITLNKAVKVIQWQKNFSVSNVEEKNFPVKVVCEDGEEFNVDCVVVTSSIGYLKENHKTLFNPPLPENKLKVLENVGFGTINKIYLVYDKAFWEQEDLGFQLVWMDNLSEESKQLLVENPWICGITGFDVVQKYSNILLCWIGGKEARWVEDVNTPVLSTVCTKILKIFLNRKDIPSPIKVFRSEWFNNKYIRGVYSYRKLGYYQSESSLHNLKHPLVTTFAMNETHKIEVPTVLFAGEAYDQNAFSSTHGAFQSGIEAAGIITKSSSQLQEYERSTGKGKSIKNFK